MINLEVFKIGSFKKMKTKTIIVFTVILAIATTAMFAGCIEEETSVPTQTQTPELTPSPTPSQSPVSDVIQAIDNETLRIGAFNIQVFGKSKASKPEVMDVLGKIIRTFDVVAIEEIRDKSQTALPALVNTVNSDGSQYAYVVGERLGRTTSKEQYAYIYNTQTVELSGTPFTYPEPTGTDPFHREPYISSFKALNGNFDVTLITIHTDPDEATEEINALDAVVKHAQSTYPEEMDFIVMGDLNADCSYFDEDSASTMSSSDYYWCISNSVDTTTKTTDCTYDRVIITSPAIADFTGDSNVFRYDIEYGLTIDETTAVSDHYPIYAVFWSNRDDDSATTQIATPAPTQKPTTKPTVTLVPAPTQKPTQKPTTKPTAIAAKTPSTVYLSDLSLADEWVKITNSGSSPVTMTGWKVTDDDAKHTYLFPSFVLSSSATVTLYTGKGTDTATELYWGGKYVWNNDGDTAKLYDASGNLIDSLKG